MPAPLVSVVVPTYNRPQMLGRALKSIQEQSVSDYEILVVNDGGEDVRHVAEQYKRVVYLEHTHNRGLPAARNTALMAARGEYIAYLDDDDIWYPLHLDICLNFITDQNRRFVYSDCYYWYDGGRYVRALSCDFDRALLQTRNLTPCICVMHERSLLNEAGMFDESLHNHEDYDLWLRMADVTDFYHIPIVTCAYSKRSDGQQMSSDARAMLDGLRFVQARHRERAMA